MNVRVDFDELDLLEFREYGFGGDVRIRIDFDVPRLRDLVEDDLDVVGLSFVALLGLVSLLVCETAQHTVNSVRVAAGFAFAHLACVLDVVIVVVETASAVWIGF